MPAERPLVSLTVSVALGVLLVAYSSVFVLFLLGAVLFLAVLFLLTRRSLCLHLLFLLVFALFGGVRYTIAVHVAPDDVSRFAPRFCAITGVVVSDVAVQAAHHTGLPVSGKFVLEARQLRAEDANIAVSGQIEARVPLAPATARNLRGARQRGGSPRGLLEQTPALDEDYSRPHYGDTLTIHGRLERPPSSRNPGGFDYAALLARRGIYTTLSAHRYDDWQRSANAARWNNSWNPPFMRVALRLREAALKHVRLSHDHERAGVLNGILLGDRGDLPGALNDDFERTGTSHVLATAGLHVGMVVVLLLGFLRLCRIARRPSLLLAFGVLILYAMMAGGRPSVIRAVVMASVVLIGMLLEREPDLPSALALAALLLLGYNPLCLFEAGFQLSFATVISIVLLMPLFEKAIRRAGRIVSDDWPGAKAWRFAVETSATCFFLALTAQLGAAPLIAYYFNDVSLVSVLANTLVVPAIALIIALGFGAACLGTLHPLLALPLDRILDSLLAWVVGVVRACSALPYASVPKESPPAWILIVYYAVLWIGVWQWQRKAVTSELVDT
jgi:ComEC/Rec2-related protein